MAGAAPNDIVQLQQRIRAFCDARDWEQFHNPKDLAISLVLEASEVLEHFQWKDHTEMNTHLEESKEDVADELADVLYWVLLMASYFEIDLTHALRSKMDKNERKYPVEKSLGNHKKYTELSDQANG